MSRLDSSTLDVLRQYRSDIDSLPNEAARSHRFIALVERLFPGSPAAREMAGGIEKMVRIDVGGAKRRGRIDAYHGNAIIEFERSLKSKEAEARRQLRHYAAGLWLDPTQRDRPLLCVATDGVVWKAFHPALGIEALVVAPVSVDLGEPIRTLVVGEGGYEDFYYWLNRLLFRRGRIEPTSPQFRADFGASSVVYSGAMRQLRAAWSAVGNEPEPALAFGTWRRYLTYTYGQLAGTPDSELVELFLKHTYLVTIARLLCWASISGGQTSGRLDREASSVISGQYFRGMRIENLAEDDFFQWIRLPSAVEPLANVWERTMEELLAYDLDRLEQDVLKSLYQELVDPRDRHELGEYYTPDWLCEKIVAEVLPASGYPSVLDPTCGSGSFLRAAIAHILAANPDDSDGERLGAILENVVGIDIHPLAVTIAKATYVVAIRGLLRSAGRPVRIPVYLADALFLPAEVQQLTLGARPSYEIRFGGDRRVALPEGFVKDAAAFDAGIAAASAVAGTLASGRRESPDSLRQRAGLAESGRFDGDEAAAGLWSLAQGLAELIRERRNSIWAFVIQNSYRPAMLRERFDYILGNPPWLSYRYISDPEYQAEVKRRATEDYEIAPKSQKLFTQMELATVFLVHSLKTFGRVGAKLAFVMPRAVLTADQHRNLRIRKYRAPVALTAYWDLKDVAPLFNVPSCVLFAERTADRPRNGNDYALPAVEWQGRLKRHDCRWAEAEADLQPTRRRARVIFLAERSALSTARGSTRPTKGSDYASEFHQGATIVPRSFYFVRLYYPESAANPNYVNWAVTDEEQAASAKPAYRDVAFAGEIEGRYLFSTAIARHVLPFAHLEPATVVLPLTVDERGALTVRNEEELRHAGHDGVATWMRKAEEAWAAARGRKAARETIYEWLDYQGKLTKQNLKSRHLILYNAAGTHLAAARLDRNSLPLRFVVEHKLYWRACATIAEADYLAAVLNSSEVNRRIKPFQSQGLLGERDIEKKALDLPISRYDRTVDAHRRLAALGARARREAAAVVERADLPAALGRRRAAIRTALAGTLEEIDIAVRDLLDSA